MLKDYRLLRQLVAFELWNDFKNISHPYFRVENLPVPTIPDRDYVSLFS